MEGLAAFFLESTFLGLWLLGWDRLPRRVHLPCIWLVSVGSMLSAQNLAIAQTGSVGRRRHDSGTQTTIPESPGRDDLLLDS
jgi:hypothetical protein